MSLYLQFVIDQFLQHKIRFLLTISGIVVGVASLAILASFIQVGKDVLRQSAGRAMGDDLLTIRESWDKRRTYPNERRLSDSDRTLLQRSVTLKHTSISAEYGGNSRNFRFKGHDGEAFVIGIEAHAFSDNTLTLTAGRPFHTMEYQDISRVAVVGASVLEALPRPWQGTLIEIDGYKLNIVGVLGRKPSVNPGRDRSWNARILLPAATYNMLFNPDKTPDSLISRVTRFDPRIELDQVMQATQVLIEQVLMVPRQHANFRVLGLKGKQSNDQTILLVIEVLMFSTTLFSMMVGGINIMNIMLVTVTERTREIGIRRALGASQANIRNQFLIESVMITGVGAVLGLLLALGGLLVLSQVLTALFYPWPFQVVWWSVFAGMGLTVVIGVVFGMLPALQAARLHPVDALRYE